MLPDWVKVYDPDTFTWKVNRSYLNVFPKVMQVPAVLLLTTRFAEGSVDASVPAIVRGEPYAGVNPRLSAAEPKTAETLVLGVMVAPLALQEVEILSAALLMSKKILLLLFTLMRPTVVLRFGTIMFSEPSLAVFDTSVYGNVCPLSVENRMSTLGEFTGATSLLATLHVSGIVFDPFAVKVVAVFCEVMAKGPLPPLTLTAIDS